MTTRGLLLRWIALALLRWVVAPATAVAPVGHLLDRGRATGELQERPGELLLFLDDRLEQVALLFDSLEHLVGIEHEQARVFCLQTLLDLVPRHRRRDSRSRPRAQRLDVHR